MSVYYNEIDGKACAWLKELMKAGLIPEGEVDGRSIEDVKAQDVEGFTQCHWFAGIGGWPLALALAGIGTDAVMWTGSCPCQPFSSSGKREGTKDRRHLWPSFFRLISECRPPVVLGEQVSAAIKHGWIDGVQADLEEEDYACGYHVYGAHSVGAPHIRQRIYWGAVDLRRRGAGFGMADAAGERADGHPGEETVQGEPRGPEPARGGSPRRLGDSTGGQRQQLDGAQGDHLQGPAVGGAVSWDESILCQCLDGKARRIPREAESILQRVADGLPGGMDGLRPESCFPLCGKVEGRTLLLRGYGNAIVPASAAEFVRAFMEVISEEHHEGAR